jgi:hypothetical protein
MIGYFTQMVKAATPVGPVKMREVNAACGLALAVIQKERKRMLSR